MPGLARLDEEPVGPHHVPDVGEVPPGRQVADRDGRGAAPVGLHDALGQGRHRELGGLARADVVERPDGDDVLAVAEEGLGHQGLGGQLAGGVRRQRGGGRLLGEGQEGRVGDGPVDLGRAGHQDPRVGPALAGRGQQGGGADHVDLEHPERLVPRLPDVGQGGQVVDGVGAGVGHRGQQGGRIGDVHLAVDGDDVIAELTQMVGQPGADEAATAGDEGAHDGSPYWLRRSGRHRRRGGRRPAANR